MKRLIIFDCDGTLVDSEVIAAKVFTQYWATHGVHFTEDEFKEKFIGTGRDAPIVVDTFSKMPAHADEEGDRIFDKELAESLVPVPGIIDLVSSLPGKLCVASNSSLKYVQSALKKTHLEKYFGNSVYSSEQVKRPKPAPDLFLHVASSLGYAPADCIVIEDSAPGVAAAKNAEMRVVGFSGASHFVSSLEDRLRECEPDWFCTNVSDLAMVLEGV